MQKVRPSLPFVHGIPNIKEAGANQTHRIRTFCPTAADETTHPRDRPHSQMCIRTWLLFHLARSSPGCQPFQTTLFLPSRLTLLPSSCADVERIAFSLLRKRFQAITCKACRKCINSNQSSDALSAHNYNWLAPDVASPSFGSPTLQKARASLNACPMVATCPWRPMRAPRHNHS